MHTRQGMLFVMALPSCFPQVRLGSSRERGQQADSRSRLAQGGIGNLQPPGTDRLVGGTPFGGGQWHAEFRGNAKI